MGNVGGTYAVCSNADASVGAKGSGDAGGVTGAAPVSPAPKRCPRVEYAGELGFTVMMLHAGEVGARARSP